MLVCIEYIHIPEYCRNLSIRRILSHWGFSIKVLKLLLVRKPNVILGVLPCNLLGLVLWFYKKMHSSVQLIIDVTDMWPESLPISKFSKNYYVFSYCLGIGYEKWGYLQQIRLYVSVIYSHEWL